MPQRLEVTFVERNFVPGANLQRGEHLLVFLASGSSGTLAWAHDYHGAFSLSVGCPGLPSGTGLGALERDIVGCLPAASEGGSVQLLKILQAIKPLSPETLARLDELSGGSQDQTALEASMTLLYFKWRVPQVMHDLAERVVTLDSTEQGRRLLWSVYPAPVLYSIKGASVFEPYASIATVSTPTYKQMAIQGLRNLGDRRAMPIFAAALGDPDSTTEHMAVMALARLTG